MIESYFTESIGRVRSTPDGWGETTTSVTNIRGRVEWGQRMIVDQAGKQALSQAMVTFAADADIQLADSLRIGGIDYPIRASRHRQDWTLRFKEYFI